MTQHLLYNVVEDKSIDNLSDVDKMQHVQENLTIQHANACNYCAHFHQNYA